jgi:hypothetical protein
MSQQSSLTQSAHSVRQVLTAYSAYQMLLGALIEAKRQPPDEYLDAQQSNCANHLIRCQ